MRKAAVFAFCAWTLLWSSSRAYAQGTLPPEVAEHGYADMIVLNGKIVSMDDAGRNTNPGNIYEAMAVKGDRIIALGTDERIRALANPRTQVIDLKGQTVIPGIVETHAHIFGNRLIAQQIGLKTPDKGINITVQAGRDIEATRLRIENGIKDALSKVQPGDWIVVGVRPNREENVTFQRLVAWTVAQDLEPRQRLDRIADNNPVLVQTGVRGNLNSNGWDLATQFMPSYTEFLSQSLGKEYADAPKRGLVGTQEMGALQWEIWFRTQPISLIAEMFRRDLDMAAAHGITAFSSRVPHPMVMDGFMWLDREGQLPVRFAALYEVHRRPNDPGLTRQFYKLTGNLTGLGDQYMWVHGVASERWDTDYPMTCLGPDVPAPPEIKKREVCPQQGEIWWDTLQTALEAGWRLAGIHGEGSDGVRRFIRMIETAMKNTGKTPEDMRKLRMTVEHAPAIGKLPDVVEGLKKYGIMVSIATSYFLASPAFLADYGPAVEPFLSPVKSLLDRGVFVVGQNHSYREIGYLWSLFMTRRINGKVIGAEEAVDRVTILKMWTNWASHYMLKEKELGSLEVGKWADFVVLDKDYFTIPMEEIATIRPQMTVMGGKIRHFGKEYAQELGKEPVGYQFPERYHPWGESDFLMGF